MLKQGAYIVVIFIALIVIWRILDKDDRLSRATENTIETIGLTMEEQSLPAEGSDTSQHTIIRIAKLEQRERDNHEWTAENRLAHPDLYLEHCSKTLKTFQRKYEAAILDVKTKINIAQYAIDDANEKQMVLHGFLVEAKHTIDDTARAYPCKVGIYTYKDVDDLKSAVVATDASLSECEVMIQQKTKQIESLKLTLAELRKELNRVKNEIAELEHIWAQTKANTLQKSVNEIHKKMEDILGGIDAIAEKSKVQPGIIQAAEEKNVDEIFSRRGID